MSRPGAVTMSLNEVAPYLESIWFGAGGHGVSVGPETMAPAALRGLSSGRGVLLWRAQAGAGGWHRASAEGGSRPCLHS